MLSRDDDIQPGDLSTGHVSQLSDEPYDGPKFPIGFRQEEDMTVAEINSTSYDWDAEEEDVHPLWHLCQRCISFARVAFVVVLIDVIIELLTFKPLHELFHAMGWIK